MVSYELCNGFLPLFNRLPKVNPALYKMPRKSMKYNLF